MDYKSLRYDFFHFHSIPKCKLRKWKTTKASIAFWNTLLKTLSLLHPCKTSVKQNMIQSLQANQESMNWIHWHLNLFQRTWKTRGYSTPLVKVRSCFKDRLWMKIKRDFNLVFQETALISKLYSKFWVINPNYSHETICRLQTNIGIVSREIKYL